LVARNRWFDDECLMMFNESLHRFAAISLQGRFLAKVPNFEAAVVHTVWRCIEYSNKSLGVLVIIDNL